MLRTIPGKGPCRLLALVLAAAVVAGCTSGSGAGRRTVGGRPGLVTSLFPIAAVLERIGGDAVAVRDLAPPGVEPHDLELTSPQLDAILDARLAVVMGRDFQPSIEAGTERRDGPTVRVLDRLGPAVHGTDPHVWLDPVLLARVVRELAPAVAATVPRAERAAIARRADETVRQLNALDAAYRAGLRRCDRRVVVTAHDAFGYLAHRYGLHQQAIAGISPDQEPDPRRLAGLADLVERDHVTTVFTEELVSPRVARALAAEAGVRTAVLDPIESPVHGDGFAGYLAAMRSNLTQLRRALGCR
jgi:zinc transport system substrate-binding protein